MCPGYLHPASLSEGARGFSLRVCATGSYPSYPCFSSHTQRTYPSFLFQAIGVRCFRWSTHCLPTSHCRIEQCRSFIRMSPPLGTPTEHENMKYNFSSAQVSVRMIWEYLPKQPSISPDRRAYRVRVDKRYTSQAVEHEHTV